MNHDPMPDRMREYRLIRFNGKINTYTSIKSRNKAGKRWANRDGAPVTLERWNPYEESHVTGIDGRWEDDGQLHPEEVAA